MWPSVFIRRNVRTACLVTIVMTAITHQNPAAATGIALELKSKYVDLAKNVGVPNKSAEMRMFFIGPKSVWLKVSLYDGEAESVAFTARGDKYAVRHWPSSCNFWISDWERLIRGVYERHIVKQFQDTCGGASIVGKAINKLGLTCRETKARLDNFDNDERSFQFSQGAVGYIDRFSGKASLFSGSNIERVSEDRYSNGSQSGNDGPIVVKSFDDLNEREWKDTIAGAIFVLGSLIIVAYGVTEVRRVSYHKDNDKSENKPQYSRKPIQ